MTSKYTRRTVLAALAAATSCAPVKDTTLPASAESGMPFFTQGPDGKTHMSWIDYLADGGHALRIASWDGRTWSPPETIASGQKWFVNWADAPSIAAMPDGSMFAHWLTRPVEGGKYGYGIRIAHKHNGGKWREIHGINLEDREDYAGFLRFAPDAPLAVYLCPPQRTGAPDKQHQHHDERSAQHSGHHHEEGHRKTLRLIEFSKDGSVIRDREVDPDVCTCCPTALGHTRDGWIAAYRDHRPGEIRDISFIRYDGQSWSEPQPVYPDGWELRGCPVEGPSIATIDNDVLIAWLTRANNHARIQYVISPDSGRSFGQASPLDDGNPVGRPQVLPFDSDRFFAMWMENTANNECELRARLLSRDGKATASMVLHIVPGARTTGYPRVVLHNEEILVAWRDKRVHTLHLPISQFLRKVT